MIRGVVLDYGTGRPLARVLAGTWEVMVAPPPYFYVVSVGGSRNPSPGHRADGWNEITARDAAVGAPVFLEPFDPETKMRLGELRSTRTDLRGDYRFFSLPPGTNRLLSTFEFEHPGEQAIETARAPTVSLKEGAETVQDVDLYVR